MDAEGLRRSQSAIPTFFSTLATLSTSTFPPTIVSDFLYDNGFDEPCIVPRGSVLEPDGDDLDGMTAVDIIEPSRMPKVSLKRNCFTATSLLRCQGSSSTLILGPLRNNALLRPAHHILLWLTKAPAALQKRARLHDTPSSVVPYFRNVFGRTPSTTARPQARAK